MAAVVTENVCKHNQNGFCKFQQQCRLKHIMEICQVSNCTNVNCSFRHPKYCKFFTSYGICKFGENCAYLHKSFRDESIVKLVDQSEKLKTEVASLKDKIVELQTMILSINNCEEPKIASSNESVLVDDSSNISNIPQFDGFSEDGGKIEFECDSCALKFIVKEEWYEHKHYGHDIVVGHDFCCDECLICFKTKLESDFHELESHAEEHYALNEIPEPTKLIFRQSKSRS